MQSDYSATLQAQTSPNNLTALTGLRGLASIVIAMGHIYIIGIDPRWQPSLIHLHHYVGSVTSYPVPLFFILSGFILMHVYGRWETIHKDRWFLRFISARVARLYPAYFVALTLMILPDYLASLLHVKIDHAPHSFFRVLTNYLLIQDWPPLIQTGSIVIPAWAVSIEWFLYLFTFPCALWLYLQIKSGRTFLILTSILIAVLFLPYPLYSTVVNSILFVLGCTLYGIREKLFGLLNKYARWADVAVISLALVLILQYFDIILISTAFALVSLCIALWIFGLSHAGSYGYRLFSHPIFVYLGTISYSLYVIHWVVFQIFYHTPMTMKTALDKSLAWYLGNGLIQTLVCIGAASILYHLVEAPGRNYLRSKFDLLLAKR